jgi:hypothetical protein
MFLFYSFARLAFSLFSHYALGCLLFQAFPPIIVIVDKAPCRAHTAHHFFVRRPTYTIWLICLRQCRYLYAATIRRNPGRIASFVHLESI